MPRSRHDSCIAKPSYYGETRAGRRVSALRFEFKRNPQGRLPLDEPKQDPGRSPLALNDLKPTRLRSARSKPTPQPATESPTWTPAAPDHLEPPKLRRPPSVWDDVKARRGRDKAPTDSGHQSILEKTGFVVKPAHGNRKPSGPDQVPRCAPSALWRTDRARRALRFTGAGGCASRFGL